MNKEQPFSPRTQACWYWKDAELSYGRTERFQGTAGRMFGSHAQLVAEGSGINLN